MYILWHCHSIITGWPARQREGGLQAEFSLLYSAFVQSRGRGLLSPYPFLHYLRPQFPLLSIISELIKILVGVPELSRHNSSISIHYVM